MLQRSPEKLSFQRVSGGMFPLKQTKFFQRLSLSSGWTKKAKLDKQKSYVRLESSEQTGIL